jgi:hypothetical protein
LAPGFGKRGKSVTVEADYYDVYLVKMGLVSGVHYAPYIEKLFFCKDRDACGHEISYEVGPVKFSNGKSFKLGKL